MARIRYGATFSRDLAAQLAYLVERADAEGIVRLREDLDELEGLLGSFPMAGRELAAAEGESLRKLKLRRCPFVVWYVQRAAEVIFTRLFHSRQDTRRSRPNGRSS